MKKLKPSDIAGGKIKCCGDFGNTPQKVPQKVDLCRGQVAQLVGALSQMHEGCGFDPQSGYIQEATNECMNKWNNKSISLSPLFLFLSQINK